VWAFAAFTVYLKQPDVVLELIKLSAAVVGEGWADTPMVTIGMVGRMMTDLSVVDQQGVRSYRQIN